MSVGEVPEKIVAHMQPGDVALLENVRFHAEEEANDPAFAEAARGARRRLRQRRLRRRAPRARQHRGRGAPSSNRPAAGFLMEKELTYLHDELETPERPFVVILGGAKVSDKIKVIDRLLDKADTIIIGGGMAYTFALALGKKIGKSLCEPE